MAGKWKRFGDEQPKLDTAVWVKTKRSKRARLAFVHLENWQEYIEWHFKEWRSYGTVLPHDADLWCPVEFKPAPPLPKGK